MGAALAVAATAVTGVSAQNAHPHTPGVSGVAGGVPYFCASPTTTSTTSGAWSDARTWSNGRVPGRDDKVAIASGHTVTYGITADVDLNCIEVGGTLAFATDVDTRMRVGTIMVLENGALELGTVAQPMQADATSVIEIVDRPFLDVDPEQLGNGIVVLGRLSAHGAVKTPTFLRLAKDARAGERALELEGSVDGWRPGDRLVVPDTRQLRAGQNGRDYQPQTEVVEVESVTAASVRLTAPLRYDHSGARNGDGTTAFLPHVANLSRNVIVRSENPDGVRGHLIFVSRADVDVRYVELDELGRTKMGILDNTRITADGRVVKIGTNQIGRYALHFHHTFGPRATPASGYQFMAVGNAINGSTKWGIVVHNSHYGLIQGNVVFNTRGGGIVTEDGTESFNVFERNFSLLTAGSRDAAPNNGYSATLPNPGGEGSAFWFRGPNNYIRDNVAANAAESGFGMPVTALGVVRIPRFKGADTSLEAETVPLDTDAAEVPEFVNNEAYGALRNGVTWAWSGRIGEFKVWHASDRGVSANPTQRVTVDGLIAVGDASVLTSAENHPVGVWVGNYVAREVTVDRADIGGLRVGVESPFFYGRPRDAKRDGMLTIANSTFRTNVGVSVATGYVDDAHAGAPTKKAVVRSSIFEPLRIAASPVPAEAISMNYGMAPRDPSPREPLLVYDFNEQTGRSFKVYYSLQAPEAVAPCHDTVPAIGGWVCDVD